MKVYVLQHVHEISSDSEDVKFIGVYSSLEQANIAKDRLQKKPGFFDSQNGFYIDEYILDATSWEDGFCTV